MFRCFLETDEPTKGNLILLAFFKSKMRNQHKVADLLMEKIFFLQESIFMVHIKILTQQKPTSGVKYIPFEIILYNMTFYVADNFIVEL